MLGPLLESGNLERFKPCGEDGTATYRAADKLRSVLSARLSTDAANTLAIPRQNRAGDAVDWYAPLEGQVKPWAALSEVERSAARSMLDELERDIGALSAKMGGSENADARAVARQLRYVTRIPSLDQVYLVGDRPVMVFWGFEPIQVEAALSKLLVLDDQADTEPARSQPRSEETRRTIAPNPTNSDANPAPETAPIDSAISDPGQEREPAPHGLLFGVPWWWLLLALLLGALLMALLFRGCTPLAPFVPAPSYPPGGPVSQGAAPVGTIPADGPAQSEHQQDQTPHDDVRQPDSANSGSGESTAEQPSPEDNGETEDRLDLADQTVIIHVYTGEEAEPQEGADALAAEDGTDVESEVPETDFELEEERVEERDGAEETGAEVDVDIGGEVEPEDRTILENQTEIDERTEEIPNAEMDDGVVGMDENTTLIIPDEALERGSTEFLNGHWRARTGLVEASTENPVDLEYTISAGRGTVTVIKENGAVCTAPVDASIEGREVRLYGNRAIECNDGGAFSRPRLRCTQGEGGMARCVGVNSDDSTYEANMQRVGDAS